jgi:DNA (cytosine-5)-methyltransferase 1
VDLFAGGGGLSAGFAKEGFEIVAAYELWEPAANCHEKNFNHPVMRLNLADTDQATASIAKFKPNVIIGGPPCQDFSQAGKRIESKQADLTLSFLQIVSSIKPLYFVMENVERIIKSKVFSKAREEFKAIGYGLTECILLASKCGVPQRRKRFFCLGSLNDCDDFLLESLMSNLSLTEMTVRDYFGDNLNFEFYYRHPRNYSRRGIFSIDEPAATIRGVNRPVPQGYPGHRNDACELNDSLRPLTTHERARIQTFPEDYKFYGTKTEIEQIIGNAVPVKLAQYVAHNLYKHINCSDDNKYKVGRFNKLF